MANQSEDPRRSEQQRKKSPKVGQPGEQQRTSQENAGSTEGGGTRNAERASTPGITENETPGSRPR
jgi:hypothetical protein